MDLCSPEGSPPSRGPRLATPEGSPTTLTPDMAKLTVKDGGTKKGSKWGLPPMDKWEQMKEKDLYKDVEKKSCFKWEQVKDTLEEVHGKAAFTEVASTCGTQDAEEKRRTNNAERQKRDKEHQRGAAEEKMAWSEEVHGVKCRRRRVTEMSWNGKKARGRNWTDGVLKAMKVQHWSDGAFHASAYRYATTKGKLEPSSSQSFASTTKDM